MFFLTYIHLCNYCSWIKSEVYSDIGSQATYLLYFNECLFYLHFRECEVFSKNHPAPFSKVITFHKKEPFELEAFYTNLHEVPYPDPRIGKTTKKFLKFLTFNKQYIWWVSLWHFPLGMYICRVLRSYSTPLASLSTTPLPLPN